MKESADAIRWPDVTHSMNRPVGAEFGEEGCITAAEKGFLLKPPSKTPSSYSSSFLLLVVRPGATSSVLAPGSDALCY